MLVFSERQVHVHVRYYAVASPSVVRRLSVCNVRAPTQPVEIFRNVSTAFGTLAIH